jgi:hypothetical protein
MEQRILVSLSILNKSLKSEVCTTTVVSYALCSRMCTRKNANLESSSHPKSKLRESQSAIDILCVPCSAGRKLRIVHTTTTTTV